MMNFSVGTGWSEGERLEVVSQCQTSQRTQIREDGGLSEGEEQSE